MEKDLTKESRKALKQIWETYSQRRKEGMSKRLAVRFLAKDYADYPDFETIRAELKSAGYLKVFIVDGDFDLTDKAIIFFENCDRETVEKWIDVAFISSFFGAFLHRPRIFLNFEPDFLFVRRNREQVRRVDLHALEMHVAAVHVE